MKKLFYFVFCLVVSSSSHAASNCLDALEKLSENELRSALNQMIDIAVNFDGKTEQALALLMDRFDHIDPATGQAHYRFGRYVIPQKALLKETQNERWVLDGAGFGTVTGSVTTVPPRNSRKRLQGLDYYDHQREDEEHYQGRYGSWKKD